MKCFQFCFNFAFKFNLRRYIEELISGTPVDDLFGDDEGHRIIHKLTHFLLGGMHPVVMAPPKRAAAALVYRKDRAFAGTVSYALAEMGVGPGRC